MYINSKEGYVYYLASPNNATQKYLYKTKLNGKGKSELISPESLKGTHNYSFSSNGTYKIFKYEVLLFLINNNTMDKRFGRIRFQ